MKVYTLCLILLCISSAMIGLSQPGSLDSSFSRNGIARTPMDVMGVNESRVNHVTVQSDGKILAVGRAIYGADSKDSFALVRYMPDGTLDKTFGNNGKVIMGIRTSYSYATYATILRNKKILVAGYSGRYSNSILYCCDLKKTDCWTVLLVQMA